MPTAVSRWGNSLAIRLPRDVSEKAGLAEGTPVEFSVEEHGVVLVRTARPRYRLAELLKGTGRKTRHEEIDWGEAVGKEAW